MPNTGARIDQALELMENGLISTEQAGELLGLTQQIQETVETYTEAYLTPRTMTVPGVVEYVGNPPIAPVELRSPPDFDTSVSISNDYARRDCDTVSYNGDSLHRVIEQLFEKIAKLEKENLEMKKVYELTIDKELERIANESNSNDV